LSRYAGWGWQTRPLAGPLSTLRVPARARTLRWRFASPFALTQRSIAGRGQCPTAPPSRHVPCKEARAEWRRRHPKAQ
jgi:hypothetical protein